MTLVSLLGKYDRKLKKYYKELLRKGADSAAAAWVCDNYSQCSTGLKAAKGYFSQNGEKGLMPLFIICKNYMAEASPVSESGIIGRFASEGLSLSGAAALSYLLFAAAGAVITEEEDEEKIINAVKNVLLLRGLDFTEIRYGVCMCERILCDDPTGQYEKMDERTKELYRNAVIRGANKEKTDECVYLKKVLERAETENRHTGFFLPLQKNRTKAAVIFIISEWLVSVLLSVALSGLISGRFIYALFIIFPVYAALKPFYDRLSSKIFPPLRLMSMDENKIPCRDTLVAVSSVLPSAAGGEKLYKYLEGLHTANTGENIKIMLLLDMKTSENPINASDEADIAAVKRVIERLNKKYGGGFICVIRDRVYSPTEEEYTGFERKRGAINALMKLLRDKNCSAFSYISGDTDKLQSMKYVLALDSDTVMTFEALRRLIAVAEHPLNKPCYDKEKRRIKKGYGIICPRTETSLSSSRRTVFSSLFTDGGSMLYCPAVNERYSDMFGAGIFTGKGLINIDAFNEAVTDKLDENRILSHDILEGAVLRTAFSSDAELSDSFPSCPDSYFSRLHRWIRGDIQNLKYLIRPLGEGCDAPEMPFMGKYQLFDNFRRAVTPIISLGLIVLSCFVPYYSSVLLLFSGLFAVLGEYFGSSLLIFMKGGLRPFLSVYFSSVIPSSMKSVLKGLISAGLLPQTALISLDAVMRAFYRSIISKRRLLQWVTASESEGMKKRNILIYAVIPFFISVLLFFLGLSWHRLLSLLIFMCIPLSLSDGIKIKKSQLSPPTENESRIISSFAAASWRFFEDNVSPLENYLPPDNIQETPLQVKATRTSPTNIGFYLVSALAAADLCFITPVEAVKRISDTVGAVERLPKYEGLLYNWYDTVKMKPLYPSYVSSVDCGNLIACLLAVKNGLYEYREYSEEIPSLCRRIQKLIDESRLSILYDKKRELFRIGCSCENGGMSDSFYDLYMSEARLMSYYECASRHVGADHWKRLGRTLKQSGSYVSAVSWTGTLFEYFMPALFLPVSEGTFQYEALKAALFLQKKKCRRLGIPYGISESCYYAVDNMLNYRYKAHGIKSLAMKRSADEESVISPYSVFLTLPFDRKSAMKNLSRLSSLHCEGQYGFYEAVDFTEERAEGEDYNIVRCYMSHHVGMSIVAVANTLLDNIFVKRFMADEKMNSATSLLEERVPLHPQVVRQPFYERKRRKKQVKSRNDSGNVRSEDREVNAYSNGELTVLCDVFGRNRCVFSGSEIYRFSDRTGGLSAAVRLSDKTVPLFPLREKAIRLKNHSMQSEYNEDGISVASAVSVHPTENALLLPVRITNKGGSKRHYEVYFYLEPSLQPCLAHEAHPAFSDMFIKQEYHEKQDCVTVYRKNSPKTPFFAAGIISGQRAVFSTDRERVIERMTDRKSIFSGKFSVSECKNQGISPCIALKISGEIGSGKSEEIVFSLTFSDSGNNALRCFSKIKNTALPHISKGRTAFFMRDPLTVRCAASLIKDSFFSSPASEAVVAARQSCKEDRRSLWELGISGDIPIITVFAEKSCPDSMIRAFLSLHRRLVKSSVPTDLVFVFESDKDYGFTGDVKLMKAINESEASVFLGVRGGIHIIFRPRIADASFTSLVAFSSAVYPDNNKELPLKNSFVPEISREYENSFHENGFSEDGFIIGSHPSVPWSHTLSNRSFGVLLTDRSLGYSWALNSGLNKLSEWSNDTSADMNGERLLMKYNGRIYDVIASSRVHFTPEYAEYFFNGEEITVISRIDVPEKGMRKSLTVTVENKSGKAAEISLFYCIFPVLAEKKEKDDFIKIVRESHSVTACNPLNSDYSGYLQVYSFDENARMCDNVSDFTEGDKRCLGILQKFVIDKNQVNRMCFWSAFGRNTDVLRKMLLKRFPVKRKIRYKAMTSDRQLNVFLSSLLYHQTKDTRLDARCGFYQCSGAWGYRDQLQDSLALIGMNNRRVRQIICKMASAQFIEGDVLHWFHAVYRKRLIYKGVRTKCSDDMLWLVYVTARYVLETGDREILYKKIPFTEGDFLTENQKESYGEYVLSSFRDTLLSHCLLACRRVFRTGKHSLPLIGSGDWNDSFSSVGEKGMGESVWLGMFIRKTFTLFAKVCDNENLSDASAMLMKAVKAVTDAIESNAWNGGWYIRGFYDDMTPLGDRGNEACEIDILTAAWSVLSDMPDKDRRKSALISAYNRLFDEKAGVLKLFSPPFNEKSKKTGYVNFYPEGVRENGGQYTHAAVWFAMALLEEGLYDEFTRVLRALIPAIKYTDGKGDIYKTEPYALAGDVYSTGELRGRGGWSLYTGSAGWMKQLADILSDGSQENFRQ